MLTSFIEVNMSFATEKDEKGMGSLENLRGDGWKPNAMDSVKLRLVLGNQRKIIMRLGKTEKPQSIFTANHTVCVILREKSKSEFHRVRRMLVDTEKYPPVIKSYDVYKGI